MVFEAGFSSLSSIVWTKTPMENITTNVTNISGIATDGRDCFVLGNFTGGSVQLDSLVAQTNYTADFFIAKVAADGTTQFIKEGCSGPSGAAIGERIAFDKNNAFYISGNSSSGSPVGSPVSFAMQTPNEHFILRYDTTGSAIWMSQFNTNLNVNTVNLVTDRVALTVSDSLSIFTAGLYKSTAHFESDSLINNFSSRDAFIFKMDQCNLSQPAISPSGSISICQGQSVTLTSSPSPRYLWSNDQSSQTITVSTTGTYSVTVSNTVGCSTTSSPVWVTVNPIPAKPTISVVGNVLASSSATGDQWLIDGTIISGASNQLYRLPTVTDTGCYSVTVTDSFGCSAISDSVCFPLTGIGNLTSQKLTIYPNPSNGDFVLSFESESREAQIIITDMLGNYVYTERFFNGTGNFAHGIRIGKIASGVYIATLWTGEGRQNEKIVIN